MTFNSMRKAEFIEKYNSPHYCNLPFEADGLSYCWGFAVMVDKYGRKIAERNMVERCIRSVNEPNLKMPCCEFWYNYKNLKERKI